VTGALNVLPSICDETGYIAMFEEEQMYHHTKYYHTHTKEAYIGGT
jgi:hypothetical protein